jgi:hypothetical protein
VGTGQEIRDRRVVRSAPARPPHEQNAAMRVYHDLLQVDLSTFVSKSLNLHNDGGHDAGGGGAYHSVQGLLCSRLRPTGAIAIHTRMPPSGFAFLRMYRPQTTIFRDVKC